LAIYGLALRRSLSVAESLVLNNFTKSSVHQLKCRCHSSDNTNIGRVCIYQKPRFTE